MSISAPSLIHTVRAVLGSPGDWGYGTSIGDALHTFYATEANADLSLILKLLSDKAATLQKAGSMLSTCADALHGRNDDLAIAAHALSMSIAEGGAS